MCHGIGQQAKQVECYKLDIDKKITMSNQPVGHTDDQITDSKPDSSATDMSNTRHKKSVCVNNPEGLHARPADLFVRLAQQFESKIDVSKGEQSVDGKSILSILTLGATSGTELTIHADGVDADEAVCQLSKLVELGFDE